MNSRSASFGPSTNQRPGLRWWAFAALLVVVGWLVTPQAVTIYDGVGQPDEPYRYVSAPPGAVVTAKPTGAHTTLPVVAGVNSVAVSMLSTENGPQVSVYLPLGWLAASAGTISVNLTPQAPTNQPAHARIDGNLYLLSMTDPASPVTFTKAGATIFLRATTAQQPGPVMEYRSGPGQEWRALSTSRVSNDVYGAVLPAVGEYALAFLTEPGPGTAKGGATGTGVSSHRGLIIVLLVSLVILSSVVLAVRWRAREVDQ